MLCPWVQVTEQMHHLIVKRNGADPEIFSTGNWFCEPCVFKLTVSVCKIQSLIHTIDFYRYVNVHFIYTLNKKTDAVFYEDKENASRCHISPLIKPPEEGAVAHQFSLWATAGFDEVDEFLSLFPIFCIPLWRAPLHVSYPQAPADKMFSNRIWKLAF